MLSTRAYHAASKKGSNFVVVVVEARVVGSKHVFVFLSGIIIQDGVNVTFQSDNLRLTQSSSNYIIIFKTVSVACDPQEVLFFCSHFWRVGHSLLKNLFPLLPSQKEIIKSSSLTWLSSSSSVNSRRFTSFPKCGKKKFGEN